MSSQQQPSLEAARITLMPSVIRTAVPLLYALLVRFGVVEWLAIDDVLVQNAITVVVTVLFYVAIRLAELHYEKIGWLLGVPRQPIYVKGQVLDVREVKGQVLDVREDVVPPVRTTEVTSVDGEESPGTN